MERFQNRQRAGQLLGQVLGKYSDQSPIIYALPRGGVVLGVEIAKTLGAELDLVIPRKIGHPDYPEYAVCAVSEDGYLVCNPEEAARLDSEWLKQEVLNQLDEAKRRREVYLKHRPKVAVRGKTAIIVDDGVATGLSMLAAIQEIKKRGAKRIIVAVPVISGEVAQLLEEQVDEVVALQTPEYYLGAVGAYYDEFDQVEDEEVIEQMNNISKVRH